MEKSAKASDTHPACLKTGCFADPTDADVPAGLSIVPLVLACNENYAPYAGVTIQSVLENAGSGHFYRVYVLHAGLTDDTIRLLESIKAPWFTVRCLNVEPLVEARVHSCMSATIYQGKPIFGFLSRSFSVSILRLFISTAI